MLLDQQRGAQAQERLAVGAQEDPDDVVAPGELAVEPLGRLVPQIYPPPPAEPSSTDWVAAQWGFASPRPGRLVSFA